MCVKLNMLHTCLRTTHDPQPFGHSTSLLSQWTRWSWGEDNFSSVNNRSQSIVLRCKELNQSQPVLYLGQLIMIDSSQILRFFTFQMSVVKLPMMYCIVLFWVVFFTWFSSFILKGIHRRKTSDWSTRDHVTLPNSKWRLYLHRLFIPVERSLIAV